MTPFLGSDPASIACEDAGMPYRPTLIDRMHRRRAVFDVLYWLEERLLAAFRVVRWVQVIVWCWPWS